MCVYVYVQSCECMFGDDCNRIISCSELVFV